MFDKLIPVTEGRFFSDDPERLDDFEVVQEEGRTVLRWGMIIHPTETTPEHFDNQYGEHVLPSSASIVRTADLVALETQLAAANAHIETLKAFVNLYEPAYNALIALETRAYDSNRIASLTLSIPADMWLGVYLDDEDKEMVEAERLIDALTVLLAPEIEEVRNRSLSSSQHEVLSDIMEAYRMAQQAKNAATNSATAETYSRIMRTLRWQWQDKKVEYGHKGTFDGDFDLEWMKKYSDTSRMPKGMTTPLTTPPNPATL